jgi:Clp amino terminal domain, pathogenicity island component
MNAMWSLSGLVQGLVGGVVTLVILALRAAIEGRSGVTFADLWTALAVGVAVGVLPLVLARLIAWRMRRAFGPGSEGPWPAPSTFTNRPMAHEFGERSPSDSGGMEGFGKFTDRARNVLTYAQVEAQRFDHSYIDTEHILLALVRESDGTAARVLETMGVELAKVRTAVEFLIGRGDQSLIGEVGLTPQAKRVIELAIDEARRLDDHYIGTEHLLLGLVREDAGLAAGVLESVGVTLERTRAEIASLDEHEDKPG